MDVVDLGGLRTRRVVKANGTTTENGVAARPLTLVLMHGYGAPGDDLAAFADMIDVPAGTTFLFPEAPTKLPDVVGLMFDARQWWPIDIGRLERAMQRGTLDEELDKEPDGLGAARDAIVAMLDAVERDLGLAGDRVVLGGFSQGSMLATDVALRSARPLAGLVVLSGTLLARRVWTPKMEARKGLPVFQSHGTEDPLLPFAIAEQLHQSMTKAGLRVSFSGFDGGHAIPPTVIRGLGAWLHALD